MSLRILDPYTGPTTAGIDVSKYQGLINWTKLIASAEHVRFAISRAGDALTPDSTFERNYKGAKAAGLIVGAYEFMRPLLDEIAQAQLVCRRMKAIGFVAGVDLPPVIDVERGDDAREGHERDVHDPVRVEDKMLRWCDVVNNELGVKPICYAGAFYAEHIHGSRIAARCPLWTPYYGHKQAAIPRSWQHWTFWQYDSSHGIDGIIGNVDHDVFRGDEQAMRAFIAQTKL